MLAETGLTLREDEAASLRLLAQTPEEELERMMLSADDFCEVSASNLTAELRRGLLERLGMYGVRYAIEELHRHSGTQFDADVVAALIRRFGPTGDLWESQPPEDSKPAGPPPGDRLGQQAA